MDTELAESSVADDLFGPNGNFYYQLLRLRHRTERQVLEDQIIQHACKGGCRVDVPVEESMGGADNGNVIALSAVSSMLSMDVVDDHIVSPTGKKIFPVYAKYRGWHLSVPKAKSSEFDVFVLVWPMDGGNSLSVDVMGWCLKDEFKRRGFSSKSAVPQVWTMQWFFLHRMTELKMDLRYNNTLIELNRRMLDVLTYEPKNIDSMVEQLARRKK